jgi:Uma2 family endonuclease
MTTTEGRVSTVTPADHMPGAKQGQWTYKDYAAFPDDGQRYEIIDGVLYMAPSPTEWHQSAVGEFFSYLRTYVKLAGLGRVYVAPFDVELAYNVVVQPDVLVVLNENLGKIIPSRVIGAPDLVVEVASPGTATHDRRKKQDAYARAGVPEYWIADSAARTIEVFTLEAAAYRSLGVFEGPAILPSLVIPVFPVQVKQFFT